MTSRNKQAQIQLGKA